MQIIAAAPCTAAMQAVSAANGCRQHPAATLRSCAASPTQRRTASGHQQRRLAARRSGGRRVAVTAASDNLTYGADWATPKDAYVTVGLSHCFVKEEGKLGDQFVIEPITANSLECMAKGAKTSFTHVFSLRLGEALQRSKAVYPPEFADAAFCENYEARCDACARTWMRPHPMDNLLDIVPLGQVKTNFNFSTSDKRVLNADHIVNDDDNIKQDLSIDVYGRKGKDEEEEAAAPAESDAAPAAAEAKEEEEADDMDALLTM